MIETPRLRLRPLARADGAALFPLFANWAVIQWLSVPPWPYSAADMTAYVEHAIECKTPDCEVPLVIEFGSEPAGVIGYRMRSAGRAPNAPTPHIGYWLGEPYWGRGLMPEAAGALIEHLFASTDCARITSGAFEGNAASLRVQEKLGFCVSGSGTLMSRPKGRELPHIDTVLDRAVWEARK
jgi:RimJ/RimL family protein N-acetyltransferase